MTRTPEPPVVLPPVEALDGLGAEALVVLLTQLGALAERARARLALVAVPSAPVVPADDDELLSYEQVATLLTAADPPQPATVKRPTPEFIADLVRRGELASVPLGKYRRIRRGDYRAWVASLRGGAVDTVMYQRHMPTRDWRRTPRPAPQDPQAEPGQARRAPRRRGDYGSQVGTGRAADRGTGGALRLPPRRDPDEGPVRPRRTRRPPLGSTADGRVDTEHTKT